MHCNVHMKQCKNKRNIKKVKCFLRPLKSINLGKKGMGMKDLMETTEPGKR